MKIAMNVCIIDDGKEQVDLVVVRFDTNLDLTGGFLVDGSGERDFIENREFAVEVMTQQLLNALQAIAENVLYQELYADDYDEVNDIERGTILRAIIPLVDPYNPHPPAYAKQVIAEARRHGLIHVEWLQADAQLYSSTQYTEGDAE